MAGNIIFVTGCARSGTSLTTQILRGLGCWLGRPADVNGLYENTKIREKVVKAILRDNGADPLSQKSFPDTNYLRPRPSLRDEVTTFMGDGPKPAYKDAKLTFIWPLFAEAFPEAKWVLVRRPDDRIIDSCIRTSFMQAYGKDRAGWQGWINEHKLRFAGMKDSGLDLVEIWPDDYIRNPESFVAVADHCGLTFDPAKVAIAVNPTAWH